MFSTGQSASYNKIHIQGRKVGNRLEPLMVSGARPYAAESEKHVLYRAANIVML